jgi:hypothetical protein
VVSNKININGIINNKKLTIHNQKLKLLQFDKLTWHNNKKLTIHNKKLLKLLQFVKLSEPLSYKLGFFCVVWLAPR